MANPVVNTTNAAGSPFWDVQASDILATGLSYLSSLQSAKTAKAVAAVNQTSTPATTLDSAEEAFLGNTNLATIAATIGAVMVLAAGGIFLFKKVK